MEIVKEGGGKPRELEVPDSFEAKPAARGMAAMENSPSVTKIVPNDDMIVVELEDNTLKTKGGILLPPAQLAGAASGDRPRVPPIFGKVVATSRGHISQGAGTRIPPRYKAGDRVAFLPFDLVDCPTQEGNHVMIYEPQVLYKING